MGAQITRIVVAAAVVIAAAIVAVVVLTGGSSYAVVAQFQDAGQLVKGNLVKVGGATIGTVGDVRLGDNGQAEIVLDIKDDQFQPLHKGTRAVLRNSSLSSVAGRVVVLEPGPNSAPELKDDDVIPAIDTRSATDVDQVLNAIDSKGRQYLQDVVHGGATAFVGSEAATNQLLERLSPALGQTRLTLEELTSDEPALQRLISSSAAVSSVFASSRDDLEQGLVAAAATLRATADEREALRRTIERGPDFLRRANSTFVNSRTLLNEARPLLRETRPLAPKLATTLRIMRPLAAETKPLLRDVRRSIPDLSDVLRRTPKLADQTVPSITELTRALVGAKPIVSELRPYAPDIVTGLSTSFGGKSAGYYDANGHYGRIGLTLDGESLPELLRPLLGGLVDTLAPLLGSGLSAVQTHVVNRCPGSAALPATDGSNPWRAGFSGTCDPKQINPLGGTP
ncbi:MlaD family protein [Patulibacter defluvii]|uniref:MlaD family protein n=1 Tax=Patulibacter defluvii TaxID=3095358 RepID=UPI002A75BC3B|nr:MlaD family protein [Patulibacter sp. DM4]